MAVNRKPDVKMMLPLLKVADLDLIPLHQAHAVGANGKKAGKRPLENNWMQTKALSRASLETYVNEQHNIGVRLGRSVLVVDIDPRNFALEGETDPNGKVLTERPDLKLEEDFGIKLSDYPTVVTGSRFPNKDPNTGLHVYMRIPKGLVGDDEKLRKTLHGYKGIDFKWYGGQVVAPGSVHPDTNFHYEWDDFNAPPITKMADAPTKLIEALIKPSSSVKVADGVQMYTPEQLQAALDTLPVEEFREQEDWQQFMMACHAATAGEGVDEFIAWSTGDPQYAGDGASIAYRWESLDANAKGGLTHLSFRKILEDHGGRMPALASEFAEVDPEEDAKYAERAKEKGFLQQINDEWTLCAEGGQVKVYKEEQKEGRTIVQRYNIRAFEDWNRNKKVLMDDKPTPLGKAWLDWSGRNQCDAVEFRPDYGDDRYPIINGRRVYNLWRGFGVKPNPNGDCSLLYELIDKALVSNQEEKEYLLNWMAYAVQKPYEPAEVACMFRGEKGTGKSTLGNYFCHIFGDHGMHIASKDLLTGRFNLHLRDLVCLFADEAFFAGDKDGESRLKGLITEKYLTFEGKGTNAEQGRNCLHIFMATNSAWAVPATADGERRFAVFDVNNTLKQDTDFFGRLHDQMRGTDYDGVGKFLHDLLHRPLGDWHPRLDVPKSRGLMEQMLLGLPPLEQYVVTMINEGVADTLCEPWEDDWPTGGEMFVAKKDFIDGYKRFVQQGSSTRLYVRDLQPSVIGRQLSAMFGGISSLIDSKRLPYKYCQERMVKTRPMGWRFGPIEKLREYLDARAGQPFDWEPFDPDMDLEDLL